MRFFNQQRFPAGTGSLTKGIFSDSNLPNVDEDEVTNLADQLDLKVIWYISHTNADIYDKIRSEIKNKRAVSISVQAKYLGHNVGHFTTIVGIRADKLYVDKSKLDSSDFLVFENAARYSGGVEARLYRLHEGGFKDDLTRFAGHMLVFE